MTHYNEYRCTKCRELASRELLVVKRVSFSEMRSPSKTAKSRVTEWLCRTCLELDPAWNMEPYSSPGHTSPALERAKANDLDNRS